VIRTLAWRDSFSSPGRGGTTHGVDPVRSPESLIRITRSGGWTAVPLPRHSRRPRSGATVALFAAVLALSIAALSASQPAAADPHYPSNGKVQQARQAAAAKAAQVAQIRAALAADGVRLSEARVTAERAAEAFNAAQIQLARRTTNATQAQADANSADLALQQARASLGRLAAQAYQNGGQPNLGDAMFSSSSLQDLLDRSTMLAILGDHQALTVQATNNARSFATSLQQRAAAALAQQRAATSKLDAARAQAARTAAAASAAVSAAQAQQQVLLSQLSSLQRTALALEQQRQAGLAAEAAVRAAAARWARQQAQGSDSPGGSSSGTAQGGLAAVGWAKSRLGLPYLWGGAGPASYDCSGLTMRAWERSGVNLPHYAASQYMLSQHVPYSAMRPGDLIFYATDTNDPATIHHVTMYIGGGTMIEAPYTGAVVQLSSIRWDGAMAWAGRP
jgi:cell wall-associated NlpC family hydrolase